jgi:4-hydroxy-tetrahydrodipicolinate synthase
MLLGGRGNVSVTANIAPRLMHQLCQAALAGDVATASAIQMRLLPLHQLLFVEPNPIPVKWAMARMGLCLGHLRLPLTAHSAQYTGALEHALHSAGLLA